jgi:hypothetical protein
MAHHRALQCLLSTSTPYHESRYRGYDHSRDGDDRKYGSEVVSVPDVSFQCGSGRVPRSPQVQSVDDAEYQARSPHPNWDYDSERNQRHNESDSKSDVCSPVSKHLH